MVVPYFLSQENKEKCFNEPFLRTLRVGQKTVIWYWKCPRKGHTKTSNYLCLYRPKLWYKQRVIPLGNTGTIPLFFSDSHLKTTVVCKGKKLQEKSKPCVDNLKLFRHEHMRPINFFVPWHVASIFSFR